MITDAVQKLPPLEIQAVAERFSLEELLNAPLPLLRARLHADLAHSSVLHIPACDYEACADARDVDAWRACVSRLASEAAPLPFQELVMPLPRPSDVPSESETDPEVPSTSKSSSPHDSTALQPPDKKRARYSSTDGLNMILQAAATQSGSTPSSTLPESAVSDRGGSGDGGKPQARRNWAAVSDSMRMLGEGTSTSMPPSPSDPPSQSPVTHAWKQTGNWEDVILPREMTSVTSISFSPQEVCHESAQILCRILKLLPNLQTVTLPQLTGASGSILAHPACPISAALTQLPLLQRINVGLVPIEDFYSDFPLQLTLCKSLTRIDLENLPFDRCFEEMRSLGDLRDLRHLSVSFDKTLERHCRIRQRLLADIRDPRVRSTSLHQMESV